MRPDDGRPSVVNCSLSSSARSSGTLTARPPSASSYGTFADLSLPTTDDAVSASMSATSSVYCGAAIQYADPTTTPTTATKIATRPAICPTDSVAVSFLRWVNSCSGFTGQRLKGHPHDVLVGLDELVADLHRQLEHRVGLLQGDDCLVNIAATVEHPADGLVGFARRSVDRTDELLERVDEARLRVSGWREPRAGRRAGWPSQPAKRVSAEGFNCHGLLGQLQGLLDGLANESDGRQVRLIGSGGAEHVDHLFGHVDVGDLNEAASVRIGMRRLVAAPKRARILDHLGDTHARGMHTGRAGRRVECLGFEHDFAAPVGLAVGAARRLGVG